MDDRSEWHPREEDLELLVEAFRRATQRDAEGQPVVDTPPVVALPERRLRAIVREEIETAQKNFMGETLPDWFRDKLGMQVDDEHAIETRRKLDDLFRMHEATRGFSKEFLKTLAGWVLAALVGILSWLGVKGGQH